MARELVTPRIDAEGFIWSSMPQGVCIIDPRLPTPRVVAKAGDSFGLAAAQVLCMT